MREYILNNKSKVKVLLLAVLVLLASGVVFVINGVGRSKASGFEVADYWARFNKNTELLSSRDPLNAKKICNIKKDDTVYVYSITEGSSTGASGKQYWYHIRYCGENYNTTNYGDEGYVLVDIHDVYIAKKWEGSICKVLKDVTGYYQYQGTKLSSGKTKGYNWCGAASIKSVIQHFTQSDSLANYASKLGISTSGPASDASMTNLINSYSKIRNEQEYYCSHDSSKRVLMNKLRLSIDAGHPVIVLVKVNENRKSEWGYSTGGHYVTVSGYNDKSGMVTICDSVGNKRVREVSIELLADCLKLKTDGKNYYSIIYGYNY